MTALVAVGETVTVTVLVVLRPEASVIVARKAYVPAAEKVAVVFLAALVPLAVKVTGGTEPSTLQV
jgi:hypothetical protein